MQLQQQRALLELKLTLLQVKLILFHLKWAWLHFNRNFQQIASLRSQ